MPTIYSKSSRSNPQKGFGYPIRFKDIEDLVQILPYSVLCLSASFSRADRGKSQLEFVARTGKHKLMGLSVSTGAHNWTLEKCKVPESVSVDVTVDVSMSTLPRICLKGTRLSREIFTNFLAQQLSCPGKQQIVPERSFDCWLDTKRVEVFYKYSRWVDNAWQVLLEGHWPIPPSKNVIRSNP